MFGVLEASSSLRAGSGSDVVVYICIVAYKVRQVQSMDESTVCMASVRTLGV
jgi:hypothetical protein